MIYDSNNNIVKLCAKGMLLEGEGKNEEALRVFEHAWDEASTDFEKFTAAHYIARHQKSIEDKLHWDRLALHLALKVDDEGIKVTYPSLYLNVGKCYEDLQDTGSARKYYELADSFTKHLGSDGYSLLIKNGIQAGIERVNTK